MKLIGFSPVSLDALKENITFVEQISNNLTAETILEFPKNLTGESANLFPGKVSVVSGKSGLAPTGYVFPEILELFYSDMLRNPGVWLVLVVLALYLVFRITGLYIVH